MAVYRIRWARVDCGRPGGPYTKKMKACIAEKQHEFFFGLVKIWRPLTNGYWRFDEARAEEDIAEDKTLYSALPPVTYMQ